MHALKQIWIIAAKEFTESTRGTMFRVAASTAAVLFLLAVAVGFVQQERNQNERRDYQALVRQQWLEQPDRHPHRVAHYGTFAFRPRSGLSFFDPGIESFCGSSIYLEAHKQNTANFSEARNSTGLLRFGELTAAMILQIFGPLLVFFLCFSSWTRECEAGTLRLLVSQGVSERTVLFGKMLGCILLCGSLLLIPGAVLLGSCALSGESAFRGDVFLRCFMLSLTYTVYFMIWTVFAVLVSAWQKQSKAALLILLSTWAALFVLLPRALPNLAATIIQTPSQPEFERNIRMEVMNGGNGHDPQDLHFAKIKRALLAKYGVSKIEDLPINFAGVSMQAGEEHTSKVFQENFQILQDLYAKQNAVSDWAALLDPFLAIRPLSAAICGSDFQDFRYFQEKAEAYRCYFIKKLTDMQIKEIPYAQDNKHRLSSSHWERIEGFSYQAPSIQTDLAAHKEAFLALFFWSICLLTCMLRFRVKEV